MRIVLLNQYYPPDVAPTGRYLHDVARELVTRGHDVVAIASRHGYGGEGDFSAESVVDGVRVQRLAGTSFGRDTMGGRVADYAAYYGGLAARLAQEERPDVVVALTTPPFLGLLAKWTAELRGARHLHWVMDLYPDVMEAHGMLRAMPRAALGRLARHAFAGADTIVTLGHAMAQRAGQYCSGNTRLQYVPLWAPVGLEPSDAPVPLRAERGWEPERPVLMYSGNLGLGHRFDEFLEAARRLGPDGPRWAFAGEGRARPRVAAHLSEYPELPVELLPYAPDHLLGAHLSSADVHLVSLDSRWEGLILPSKLQGSFAVGRPVIHVGNPYGDLARFIQEAGAGWVAPQGDVEALLDAVAQALDPDERARRGAAAKAYARASFCAESNIARMADLITGSATAS